MSGGILTRIHHFSLRNPSRFKSTKQPSLVERRKEVNGGKWKELEDLSYGKRTMEHREMLKKTFMDLRRVLEKNSDMKLNEIGSYAVGASIPSSDLDVVLIPYANDEDEERIDEFNRKMKMTVFRQKILFPVARKLEQARLVKGHADVLLHPKVPIIKGTTRSGVRFDLQIGAIDTIYSTNYVRLAFQLDPRQILVYHWLRQQAEKHEIFGGRHNLLTSFHLYMLIIHFIQATKIVPVLLNEYALHVSRACYWVDLIQEFRNGKNTVPPLYTREEVETWAPALIEGFLQYYGKIDFTTKEIDVTRGIVKERRTNQLLLIEPFHDQDIGVCRVSNGATLMNKLFEKLTKSHC
ncbi:hypothetical protein PENTCL1PPCAC_2211 [Pristionchus entomophagus]|uniref:Polymerase nucleotidyl transferase domain-containing protein n=1 Tax=Pristionchus entomophagus TaxID=358040 RepID=A0AAV5S9Z3_9BILA|nr:hypothetical protein PENTCL1PPCAC_2211 [Pristionchus entomophagus]